MRAVLSAILCLMGAELTAQLSPVDPLVARYLDAQTVAVGWIDISGIDIGELDSFRQKLGHSAPTDLAELTATRDALQKLGVRRIYWISDLAGLMRGPDCLVIPTPNPKAVGILLKAITKSQATMPVFEEDGACLIGTTPQTVSSLRQKNGDAIPELLESISLMDGPHGISLAGPKEVVAGAAGMMMAYAASQPEAYAKALTEIAALLPSIRWVTLSGEIPPSSMLLRIETHSPDAAKQLAMTMNRLSSSQPDIDGTCLRLEVVDNSVRLKANSVDDTLNKLETARTLMRGGRNPDSANSMKNLALAIHNYHDAFGSFPAQSLVSAQGKRLLSWRVLVLPYLDQTALYQEFRLDEPWNSEHNLRLVEKMPDVFRSAGTPGKPGTTRFVCPLTSGSAMGRVGPPVKFSNITDGTSNTIWLVEADESHAVIWTKPDDLTIDEKDPVGSIIGPESKGFLGSRADGSVRYFSRDNDGTTIMNMFSIDGGESIDWSTVK